MSKEKLYRYNKPAKEGEKKAPFILCSANNEMHAMQLLRERFEGERIDKSLIVEYVEKNSEENSKGKKKNK